MTTIQTVCPHCAVINRVDSARLGGHPNCGQCHKPLFQGNPLEVDDATFQRLLEKEQLPLVVDFWAAWCGPCKMMAPVFAAIAAEMEPRVRFIKVDTERAQRTATAYKIRSIPTLMVFKDGQVVAQQAGALPLQALRQWLQQVL